MRKTLPLLIMMLGLSNCGDANLNKFLFVHDAQTKSLDSLLFQAQYEYDQGRFDQARKFAEQALEINGDNEESRILLGYIYLSLGGIDVFQLSKALISDSKKDSDASNGENNGDKSDAAGTLSNLGSISKVSEDEYPSLGEEKTSDLEIFEEFPVIYPTDASSARNEVTSLKYLNLALDMACPYVDSSTKLENDPRHHKESCQKPTGEIRLAAKAHFLWAFSHLAEAITFNKIIQFSSGEDSKPNLEKRGLAANSLADNTNLATYVNVMDQLSNDIDSIMQVDNPDSQLNAVLNNMNVAKLAFGKMSGLPASITRGITRALDSIQKGAAETNKSENQVLKGQLNKKVTTQFASRIDKAAAEKPAEFNTNKAKLCSTFAKISEGQGTKPTSCK